MCNMCIMVDIEHIDISNYVMNFGNYYEMVCRICKLRHFEGYGVK